MVIDLTGVIPPLVNPGLVCEPVPLASTGSLWADADPQAGP